jgi:hypothetical protein
VPPFSKSQLTGGIACSSQPIPLTITDEKAMLRAMFEVGYFPPNTPPPR